MSLFSKVSFFFFVAKCDLKLYDMEDSRNKLPINFQVHIMLSSMMKTHTVLLLSIPFIISLSLHTVVYPRHTHCAPGWALVSVLVCSSAAVIKHWPKATFRSELSGIELTVYLQRKQGKSPHAGAKAETMERCCLLVYWTWTSQLIFSYLSRTAQPHLPRNALPQ